MIKSRRWATTLSVINVIVYIALMAMSRPKVIEGVFADADIDFYPPPSELIALALNGPAMWVAWGVDAHFDITQWWFKWCLGVVPTFILWYLIGLWLDRFHLPALSSPVPSWRNATRLTTTVVLCSMFWLAGSVWAQLYASQKSPFDYGLVGICLFVIWPAVICAIAIRTIWRGVY